MSEMNRDRNGQRGTRTRQSSADRIQAVQNARNLGAGSGQRRNTATSGNRRRNKRRHQGPDPAKILLIVIGIVIVVLCVAVGLRGCAKKGADDETPEETSEPETELEAEITINGISVHGLTRSQAREQILEDMDWAMTVSLGEDTREVDNLLEGNLDDLLDEVFGTGESVTAEETQTYTVSTDGVEEPARAFADTVAAEWDTAPKNGSITSYDKEHGEFVFGGAEDGKEIDRDRLVEDILAAVEKGDYDAKITVEASTVAPEISAEQAKANFKRLGTFTTTTTANSNRNENIRIASSTLNGVIVQPGQEFSFNLTTGNRTTEKGYKPAGAYQNGVFVEEPGGGVCQVSSTLYNAVVFSGLETTERHAHTYEPSYVTPGEDAMVSYDGHSGPDMKFVNNSKTAVGIRTSFSDRKLTISIYGNPILEEGVTLSMESKKTKELDPPPPTYEEDPYLELDVEEEAVKAIPGSVWVTNLVTKKNGAVVSDELFHTSTYTGKPATIKRNTSGVVLTTSGESVESSSEETSASVAAPTETQPTMNYNPLGPGYEPESVPQYPGDQPPQNIGPGEVIQPSETQGSDQGPGGPGNVPAQTPAPAGPAPQSDGPAPQAETQASPGDVGLIAPIG